MTRATIKSVRARICFNSRGEEAVEVDVQVGDQIGRACSPSGASVGRFEAVSLPKGGAKQAVHQISKYFKKLVGHDATEPKLISHILREIDGTENFSRIGGSAAYAISLASAEAASMHLGLPLFKLLRPRGRYRLPFPLGNVLGGAKHAGKGAPDIQEFLSCPVGAKSIFEALRLNKAVHREVGRRIEKKDRSFTGGRGDEGGWAPHLSDDVALEIVSSSIDHVSREEGKDIRLGIDFAGSSLWDKTEGIYLYRNWGVRRDSGEQMEYVSGLIRNYKLFYVEDPFHQDAPDDFTDLISKNKGTFVVGDDLFATSVSRVMVPTLAEAANAAILKVNQAGTLSDALRFAKEAERKGLSIVASHRSGESVDNHLAHIAIATDSVMIKSGVVGGERIAKLNELLRISDYGIRSMAILRFPE